MQDQSTVVLTALVLFLTALNIWRAAQVAILKEQSLTNKYRAERAVREAHEMYMATK